MPRAGAVAEQPSALLRAALRAALEAIAEERRQRDERRRGRSMRVVKPERTEAA